MRSIVGRAGRIAFSIAILGSFAFGTLQALGLHETDCRGLYYKPPTWPGVACNVGNHWECEAACPGAWIYECLEPGCCNCTF
jgi:hypothetical protein